MSTLASERRALRCGSSNLGSGVPPRVHLKLLLGGVHEIHTEYVREAKEIDEDIGNLELDLDAFVAVHGVVDLIIRPPLEVLQKLAQLDGDAQSEISRCV